MINQTDSGDMHKCPMCAELIKRKAVFCKHCKSQIPPDVISVGEGTQANSNFKPSAPASQNDDRAPKATPSSGSKKIPAFLLIACCIIFLTLAMVNYLGSVKDSSTVASSVLDTVNINRSFQVGVNESGDGSELTYHVDRVEREAGSAGVTNLAIHYSINNTGTRPASPSSRNQFVIMTDEADPRQFNSQDDSGSNIGELQPGLGANDLVAKFDIPTEQLRKHLILHLHYDQMPFYFKDATIPAYSDKKRESEQQSTTEQPSAASSENQDNSQLASPSSASTSPDNQSTETHTFIDQILQSKELDDQSAFSEIKSRLNEIPKPTPGDTVSAERLNKLGLRALKNSKFSDAATLFQSASKADPSDPKLLSNLGFAELNAGDLEGAEKSLVSSIALAPGRSVAWSDLGLVMAKKGDRERAVAGLLIGYRLSDDKTLKFLQSLQSDHDPAIVAAANLALARAQAPAGQSEKQ